MYLIWIKWPGKLPLRILAQTAPMPVLWILLVGVLAACNGPGRYFEGTEVTRIAIGDSEFDVRLQGHLAEAVRVNPRYAPRLGAIGDEAAMAMAQASGCRVIGILGDQSVTTGILDCGPDPPGPGGSLPHPIPG